MLSCAVRRIARALACLAFGLAAVPGFAQDAAAARASALKAAYLFNFLQFVEWPPSHASGPLQVCFADSDEILAAFTSGLKGRTAGSRTVVTRRVTDIQQAQSCNVLYVASSAAQVGSAFGSDPAHPMLTVSDAQRFVQRGGMIELFTDGNRLRFNINVDNAQRAGLRISASLLQLAATIERRGP